MTEQDERSADSAGGDRAPGMKRRRGRVARSVRAALVAALSIAILLCVGYMLLAGLFASGNPALSRRIMAEIDRKSTRLNSSHSLTSRMPSSA